MRFWKLAAFLLVTFLGSSARPHAHFVAGTFWVADETNNVVWVVNPFNWNHFVALDSSQGIDSPSAITFVRQSSTGCGAGLCDKLLVASYGSSTVLKIELTPADLYLTTTVLTAADGLAGPHGGNGIIIGDQGSVYVGNFDSQQILRFDENFQNGTVFADSADGIVRPDGMAFLAEGAMLVANRGSADVLRIDTAGVTTTWDTIPGETPISIANRTNFDVYVRTLSGNVYRYPNGVPAARVLLGNYGAGEGSMAFDLNNNNTLYVASTGQLAVVNANTGSFTVPITPAWVPSSMIVVGGQYAPGAAYAFGTGLAGAGGVIPGIDGNGAARIGQTLTVETRDFVGGAPTALALGLGTDTSDFFGGSVHIDFSAPWVQVPLLAPGAPGVPGEGDIDTPVAIPLDASLAFSNIYLQHAALDPAAVAGVSLTNCLTLYVGL